MEIQLDLEENHLKRKINLSELSVKFPISMLRANFESEGGWAIHQTLMCWSLSKFQWCWGESEKFYCLCLAVDGFELILCKEKKKAPGVLSGLKTPETHFPI